MKNNESKESTVIYTTTSSDTSFVGVPNHADFNTSGYCHPVDVSLYQENIHLKTSLFELKTLLFDLKSYVKNSAESSIGCGDYNRGLKDAYTEVYGYIISLENTINDQDET